MPPKPRFRLTRKVQFLEYILKTYDTIAHESPEHWKAFWDAVTSVGPGVKGTSHEGQDLEKVAFAEWKLWYEERHGHRDTRIGHASDSPYFKLMKQWHDLQRARSEYKVWRSRALAKWKAEEEARTSDAQDGGALDERPGGLSELRESVDDQLGGAEDDDGGQGGVTVAPGVGAKDDGAGGNADDGYEEDVYMSLFDRQQKTMAEAAEASKCANANMDDQSAEGKDIVLQEARAADLVEEPVATGEHNYHQAEYREGEEYHQFRHESDEEEGYSLNDPESLEQDDQSPERGSSLISLSGSGSGSTNSEAAGARKRRHSSTLESVASEPPRPNHPAWTEEGTGAQSQAAKKARLQLYPVIGPMQFLPRADTWVNWRAGDCQQSNTSNAISDDDNEVSGPCSNDEEAERHVDKMVNGVSATEARQAIIAAHGPVSSTVPSTAGAESADQAHTEPSALAPPARPATQEVQTEPFSLPPRPHFPRNMPAVDQPARDPSASISYSPPSSPQSHSSQAQVKTSQSTPASAADKRRPETLDQSRAAPPDELTGTREHALLSDALSAAVSKNAALARVASQMDHLTSRLSGPGNIAPDGRDGDELTELMPQIILNAAKAAVTAPDAVRSCGAFVEDVALILRSLSPATTPVKVASQMTTPVRGNGS